jgi:hypothetical protein
VNRRFTATPGVFGLATTTILFDTAQKAVHRAPNDHYDDIQQAPVDGWLRSAT